MATSAEPDLYSVLYIFVCSSCVYLMMYSPWAVDIWYFSYFYPIVIQAIVDCDHWLCCCHWILRAMMVNLLFDQPLTKKLLEPDHFHCPRQCCDATRRAKGRVQQTGNAFDAAADAGFNYSANALCCDEQKRNESTMCIKVPQGLGKCVVIRLSWMIIRKIWIEIKTIAAESFRNSILFIRLCIMFWLPVVSKKTQFVFSLDVYFYNPYSNVVFACCYKTYSF